MEEKKPKQNQADESIALRLLGVLYTSNTSHCIILALQLLSNIPENTDTWSLTQDCLFNYCFQAECLRAWKEGIYFIEEYNVY